MIAENWIYKNTKDNKARFLLGEKGDNCLICIGINPSTAEPNILDRTLASVKRFSLDLGYDAWLMLNVYPQRATNPNNLDREINMDYHNENLVHIESVFKWERCHIWAAWGTLIKKRKYLYNCLYDIHSKSKRYNVNWYTIGNKSTDGHPHHPLYLKKGLRLNDFNINEYLGKQI